MRWDLITPEGHVVRCARPVDTATHPDFERRGVFRALTNEAISRAREQQIDLIFNTPNAKSGAGYLSMGWREVGWIGVMARPHLGRAAPLPVDRVPDLDLVAPGVEKFAPIDRPDRPPRGLRTPRHVEYQEWRFAGHPTVRYGMVPDGDGAGVVRAGARRGRTELVLSDLLGGAGSKAVSAAARINRAAYLAGFFSAGSPERAEAVKAGMIKVPRLKALHLVAMPLAELDTDPFALASWDIATSDLELL
jgi:hypothetical protein